MEISTSATVTIGATDPTAELKKELEFYKAQLKLSRENVGVMVKNEQKLWARIQALEAELAARPVVYVYPQQVIPQNPWYPYPPQPWEITWGTDTTDDAPKAEANVADTAEYGVD